LVEKLKDSLIDKLVLLFVEDIRVENIDNIINTFFIDEHSPQDNFF